MLSKTQRNIVYKRALKIYDYITPTELPSDLNSRIINLDGMYHGICWSLDRACKELYFDKDINGFDIKNFPEMNRLKPKDVHPGNYWMPPTQQNIKIRRDIINQLIKLSI